MQLTDGWSWAQTRLQGVLSLSEVRVQEAASPVGACMCVTKTPDNQLELRVPFAAIEHSDPTDGAQMDVLDFPGVILNQTSSPVTDKRITVCYSKYGLPWWLSSKESTC